MPDPIARAIQFAEANAVALLGLSLAMLLGALIVLPAVIVRLPRTYFAERRRPRPLARNRLLHWLLMTLKNGLGLLLAMTGILLMFLPGQGLLTLIIGLAIMNYPGKFRFERWLVRRPGVMPALNWLRSRRGAPPFAAP